MTTAQLSDAELVEQILAGSEDAFTLLVQRYYAPMVRLARSIVHNRESAEEVVQDAWVGVLKGLAKFEGRSAVKTWLFRIVVNRSITRRKKEGRSIAFSQFGEDAGDDPAVDQAEPPQSG